MRRTAVRARRPPLRVCAIAATALLGAVGAAVTALPAPAPAAAGAPIPTGPPPIAASVAPAELALGSSATVTGSVQAPSTAPGSPVPAAPTSVALQADRYPFRGYVTVARATTAPDGTFSFTGLHPDRNTRLRAVLDADPSVSSGVLSVTVDPRVATASRSLGPGQSLLSIRMRHTRLGGRGATAWWYVQAHGSRLYRLMATTPTRELAPGLLYASATIDPPSRRFAYRVCVNPEWEAAMGAPVLAAGGDPRLPA